MKFHRQGEKCARRKSDSKHFPTRLKHVSNVNSRNGARCMEQAVEKKMRESSVGNLARPTQ